MDYNHLENLTKSELIQLFLNHKQKLQNQQPPEPDNGADAQKKSTEAGNIVTQQAVRQALRRLDDLGYLGKCTLAQILSQKHPQNTDGLRLQHLLTGAVAMVKPVNKQANRRRQLWYQILCLTYLDKKNRTRGGSIPGYQ